MKKLSALFACLLMAGFLSACANEGHYPVSGEECGPDDPVQSVDPNAANCLPTV